MNTGVMKTKKRALTSGDGWRTIPISVKSAGSRNSVSDMLFYWHRMNLAFMLAVRHCGSPAKKHKKADFICVRSSLYFRLMLL